MPTYLVLPLPFLPVTLSNDELNNECFEEPAPTEQKTMKNAEKKRRGKNQMKPWAGGNKTR